MSKKKIVVFSGAGLDAESGVETFRGGSNSTWNNYKVDEVATIDGWRKNRSKVLDFYNERRKQMPDVQPNAAHIALSKLEDKYDVINVTQNVSDLLERGGSKNIIHLHGELTKACDVMTKKNKYTIGYNDIELGVKCPETDSQLRPDIVWFGEIPYRVDEAYDAVYNADVLLIVGTSLQITYTLDMLNNVRQTVSDASNPCRIVYIDPAPMRYLDNYGLNVEYVTKSAVEGVTEIVNELLAN
jgi:NAD-dependent deacetylase